MIKDSGGRKIFESGAQRDIQEGKGRCDLMPLDVLSELYKNCGNVDASYVFGKMYEFVRCENLHALYDILEFVTNGYLFKNPSEAFIETSIHFEEGAEKYGENNWQKGLPAWCYVNSAIRHFLKWLRGDEDERHDRAFAWNIMCCIWTVKNLGKTEGNCCE